MPRTASLRARWAPSLTHAEPGLDFRLSPEPRPQGPPGLPDRVPDPKQKGQGHPGLPCQARQRSHRWQLRHGYRQVHVCWLIQSQMPRGHMEMGTFLSQNPLS